MRTVIAAVAIALMTAILAFHATPSGAQVPSISEKPKGRQSESEAANRAAAKRADDKAYKDAVDNVPDQKKLDPWRNLR
jgi:hypothetical protein